MTDVNQTETHHDHGEALQAICHTAQTTTLMAMTFSWALTMGGCGLNRDENEAAEDELAVSAEAISAGDAGVNTTTARKHGGDPAEATPVTHLKRRAIRRETFREQTITNPVEVRNRFRAQRSEYELVAGTDGRGPGRLVWRFRRSTPTIRWAAASPRSVARSFTERNAV